MKINRKFYKRTTYKKPPACISCGEFRKDKNWCNACYRQKAWINE